MAAFATWAPAQGGDYDLDKTSPGTLGTSLDLAFSGANANKFGLFMFSLSGGPTSLTVVQPADTRMLGVGTDLISNWQSFATGVSGSGTLSVGLPLDPAFQGVEVHVQTLTTPGPSLIVDQISNKVIATLGQPATTTTTGYQLLSPRALAAIVHDRDNDAGAGDVIIAGGGTGSLLSASGLATSERYGFRELDRTAGPNLTIARALMASVELPDGRTLLAGGLDANGNVLSSCEIYDPATNSFSATGSMGTARVGHGATVMPNGLVLVAGGTSTLSDATAAITSTLRTAEIYNPGTGTWSNARNIGGFRLGSALHTLSNGQVMISGGVEVSFFFGIPINAVSTTTCQFYNPGNDSWSNAPSMRRGRAYHQDNQVRLNDGRLLLTGGAFVPDLLGAASAGSISDAEYYDPTAGAWTSANMSQSRAIHTATLLPDGRVFVAGGAQGTLQAPAAIASTELFDPTSNAWSTGPALQAARLGHVGFTTPDGLVVLVGGQGGTGATLGGSEAVHF